MTDFQKARLIMQNMCLRSKDCKLHKLHCENCPVDFLSDDSVRQFITDGGLQDDLLYTQLRFSLALVQARRT